MFRVRCYEEGKQGGSVLWPEEFSTFEEALEEVLAELENCAVGIWAIFDRRDARGWGKIAATVDAVPEDWNKRYRGGMTDHEYRVRAEAIKRIPL